MPERDRLWFAYRGQSMAPTLREPMMLEIARQLSPIMPGDVIVFRTPHSAGFVVHRVAAVTDDGLLTRGDNSRNLDIGVRRPEDILGKVVAAHRGRQRIAITGGRRGVVYQSVLLQKIRILFGLKRCLQPVYRGLADMGTGALFPSLAYRRDYVTPQGTKAQIFVGKRNVAYWNGEWRVRAPYRLLIPPHLLTPPRCETASTPS